MSAGALCGLVMAFLLVRVRGDEPIEGQGGGTPKDERAIGT